MNTLRTDLGTGDLCDNIGLVPFLEFVIYLYPICLFTITTSMRKYDDRLFEIMHQFHCVLFASISRPSPICTAQSREGTPPANEMRELEKAWRDACRVRHKTTRMQCANFLQTAVCNYLF